MSDRSITAVCAVLFLLLTGAVVMAAQSVNGGNPQAVVSAQKNNELVTKGAVSEKPTGDAVINKKETIETKEKDGVKAGRIIKKTAPKKIIPAKRNKKVASRKIAGFDAGKVIRYAVNLKGAPYKSGGGTTKGFDCSGFTAYVFKNSVGISLPHSSAAQSGVGQALDRDKLIPGALVYFNTSGSGVSHVGIYIGDGKFIDSSNSKGVAVNSLGDKYWGSRYLGARLVK